MNRTRPIFFTVWAFEYVGFLEARLKMGQRFGMIRRSKKIADSDIFDAASLANGR
jgi:hypothetical protein